MNKNQISMKLFPLDFILTVHIINELQTPEKNYILTGTDDHHQDGVIVRERIVNGLVL